MSWLSFSRALMYSRRRTKFRQSSWNQLIAMRLAPWRTRVCVPTHDYFHESEHPLDK